MNRMIIGNDKKCVIIFFILVGSYVIPMGIIVRPRPNVSGIGSKKYVPYVINIIM